MRGLIRWFLWVFLVISTLVINKVLFAETKLVDTLDELEKTLSTIFKLCSVSC